jgi:hypothetical protein
LEQRIAGFTPAFLFCLEIITAHIIEHILVVKRRQNMVTVEVKYGMSIKHKVAYFMHRRGLFRVAYEVPIVNDQCERIGGVYTLAGNKAAVWLMSKLFKSKRVVQPFSLAK